MGIYWEADSW